MLASPSVDRIAPGKPIVPGGFGVPKRLSAARRFTDWHGLRAVDVGCGNGAYTEAIAADASCVVGVDIERGWLAAFRRRRPDEAVRVPLAQCTAEHLPLAGDCFDVAFCIETLEHVRDERQALEELFRVLRSGGHLVLTVPNKWYLFETHGMAVGPITGNRVPFVSWLPRCIHSRIAAARIYQKRDVDALLRAAGFVDVRMDCVMPPLDKLGSRRLRTVLRTAVAIGERTVLRHFGVSIVTVARKPSQDADDPRPTWRADGDP
jgi:2-polyprenyl-3-methyl-5-hydroxy-6-metoxy-1,4-benzoquinol methylase